MEYTQWGAALSALLILRSRLNPCCNGIYSMSMENLMNASVYVVLILVVMEYTQWEYTKFGDIFDEES